MSHSRSKARLDQPVHHRLGQTLPMIGRRADSKPANVVMRNRISVSHARMMLIDGTVLVGSAPTTRSSDSHSMIAARSGIEANEAGLDVRTNAVARSAAISVRTGTPSVGTSVRMGVEAPSAATSGHITTAAASALATSGAAPERQTAAIMETGVTPAGIRMRAAGLLTDLARVERSVGLVPAGPKVRAVRPVIAAIIPTGRGRTASGPPAVDARIIKRGVGQVAAALTGKSVATDRPAQAAPQGIAEIIRGSRMIGAAQLTEGTAHAVPSVILTTPAPVATVATGVRKGMMPHGVMIFGAG